MKLHRARTAKPQIDGQTEPHHFIELEADIWVEVSDLDFTHEAIHRFLEKEREEGVFHLRYASNAFRVGLVRDWEEAKPIR